MLTQQIRKRILVSSEETCLPSLKPSLVAFRPTESVSKAISKLAGGDFVLANAVLPARVSSCRFALHEFSRSNTQQRENEPQEER